MSDRAAYWQRLLTDWEQSGLSQAEFCRRRRVKAVTFAWWKRRLKGTQGRESKRQTRRPSRAEHAGFVEVALPREPSSADALHPAAMLSLPERYELVLQGGARLHLPAEFDPERVARLVRAMVAANVHEHGAGSGGCPAC